MGGNFSVDFDELGPWYDESPRERERDLKADSPTILGQQSHRNPATGSVCFIKVYVQQVNVLAVIKKCLQQRWSMAVLDNKKPDISQWETPGFD